MGIKRRGLVEEMGPNYRGLGKGIEALTTLLLEETQKEYKKTTQFIYLPGNVKFKAIFG